MQEIDCDNLTSDYLTIDVGCWWCVPGYDTKATQHAVYYCLYVYVSLDNTAVFYAFDEYGIWGDHSLGFTYYCMYVVVKLGAVTPLFRTFHTKTSINRCRLHHFISRNARTYIFIRTPFCFFCLLPLASLLMIRRPGFSSGQIPPGGSYSGEIPLELLAPPAELTNVQTGQWESPINGWASFRAASFVPLRISYTVRVYP